MARKAPYVVNYIPQLQARGMNATEALQWLKDRDMGIRRQTFLRAWGETQAALAARPTVQQARIDRRPVAQEIVPMTTKTATGFRYQVDALIKRGIDGEVYRTPTAAKFDRLVSYDTALQAALGALSDAQRDEGSLAGDQIIGGVVSEVRELTPSDFEEDG